MAEQTMGMCHLSMVYFVNETLNHFRRHCMLH